MTYLGHKLSITGRLVAAAVPARGLGDPLVLIANAVSTYNAAGTGPHYLTADTVAAAITAGDLTAQEGTEITTILSQDRSPDGVWVMAYDTDPGAAATAAENSGFSGGAFYLSNQTDAQVSNLGAWLTAGNRWLTRVGFCQSANADLLTAGKAAALAGAEVETMFIYAHDDPTEPAAAAACGRVTGYPMITGPAAVETRIKGVALAGFTASQETLAIANGCQVLKPMEAGAAATRRVTSGIDTYGDVSGKGALTFVYSIRRMRDALATLLLNRAIDGAGVPKTAGGVALVRGALNVELSSLAEASHYEPGTVGDPPNELQAPDGYILTVGIEGTDIAAYATLRIGAETKKIRLDVTGSVV
jgi:hypothetical protein